MTPLAGHKNLDSKWEKVLCLCREALVEFGNESPRYVALNASGPPTSGYMAVLDDSFRNNLQNPATVRGYLRDLEIKKKVGFKHLHPHFYAQ